MPPKRGSKKPSQAASRSSNTGPLRSNSLDDQGFGDDEDRDTGMEDEPEINMAHELRVMEQNLKRSVTLDVGVRKEQKQQRLEHDFNAQVTSLESQIEQRQQTCREESRRAQNAYLDRLTTLLRRKAEVEKQIVQHTQEFAVQYLTTKEEFEAVVLGRSEDVHDAIDKMKNVAEDMVAK